MELNHRYQGQADITFALGVVTSHGGIPDVGSIDDYLTRAADSGVTGVAFFTWSTLEPFLDELDRHRYIDKFTESVSPP